MAVPPLAAGLIGNPEPAFLEPQVQLSCEEVPSSRGRNQLSRLPRPRNHLGLVEAGQNAPAEWSRDVMTPFGPIEAEAGNPLAARLEQ